MRGLCWKVRTAAIAAAIGAYGLSAFAQTPLTPLVLTGDPAPDANGDPLGLNYDLLLTPYTASPLTANNSAALSFQATLMGIPAGSELGIWAGPPNDLRLAARTGFEAPGVGPLKFSTFSQPQVDGSGRVAFFATINKDPSNHGIWAGLPGSVSLIVKTAQTAPGFAGGTFNQLADGDRALIASGQVTFRGSVRGGDVNGGLTNDTGIWIASSGSPLLAAREGTVAPGTTGAVWGDFTVAASTPVINASGKVIFRNTLSGGDTTPDTDDGIWISSTSLTQIVVRAGDLALGAGGPTFDSFLTQPSLNNSDRVAYRASLKVVGEVTAANNTGIWTDSATTGPTLIAREGSPAPVGDPTINFADLGSPNSSGRAVINSANQVAFIANLTGPAAQDQGIFIGAAAGSLSTVARKGAVAPGTGGLATFSGFDTNFTVNNSGQTAFLANVAGLSGGNDRGIWAVDPWNQLTRVVVEGQGIDVGPEVMLTVRNSSGLALAGNSTEVEGRSAGFTDTGILSFTAAFTDGSTGIFNARVGGPARVAATPPTLGPSVSNNFFTLAPLPQETPGEVSGDIGYLKFQGFSPSGTNDILIHLDFTGSNLAGAVDELTRGGEEHGYTVAASSRPGFELMLRYAAANTGIDRYFYWNFANVDDIDLVRVMATPEPGSAVMALAGAVALLRRRR